MEYVIGRATVGFDFWRGPDPCAEMSPPLQKFQICASRDTHYCVSAAAGMLTVLPIGPRTSALGYRFSLDCGVPSLAQRDNNTQNMRRPTRMSILERPGAYALERVMVHTKAATHAYITRLAYIMQGAAERHTSFSQTSCQLL